VFLGLIGLGAAAVAAGGPLSDVLGRLQAKASAHDPTGLSGLIPGGGWRYYSVTGSVTPQDATTYALKVTGLVDHPVTYRLADLEALPQLSFTDTFHCVTGWHVPDVPWTGVLLSDLLDRAAPTTEAVGVRFRSFDGVYSESLPLSEARGAHVIVALEMLGGPVSHDHGGPVRMYVDGQYGYKSTKWLSAIELTEGEVPGYWEHRGYDIDGTIRE